MRVTNKMIYDKLTADSLNTQNRLLKTYEELASGKKINRPSDNPVATSSIYSYKKILSGIEQYKTNINSADSYLKTSEAALSGVSDLLQRMKELSVAMGDDTITSSLRQNSASEASALLRQFAALGNTKQGDSYVFSGYLVNTAAYDNSNNYQGDANEMNVKIGADQQIAMSVAGSEAFSDPTKRLSAVLGSTVGTGTLAIAAGSGDTYSVAIDTSNDEPAEIRDTINAPMSKAYATTDAIGTGTLTIKAGTGSAQSLTVSSSNNTPALLAAAINALSAGVEARVVTDTTTSQVRLALRPTTPGTYFSIDVTDGDANNIDLSGLSALLHNDVRSNLTANAMGIEATVINGTSGKRLLFRPNTDGQNFTITVTDGDGTNTNTSGLSVLYHNGTGATNLSSSISFPLIFDHLANSLTNNDAIGIKAANMLADGAMNQLLSVTADVGSRLSELESQSNWLDSFNLESQTLLSNLEDSDITEVASRLSLQQMGLESLQKAMSKAFELNIFNFIR